MTARVILARNAELNVAQCVETLRAHADEVILLDADSDDRTVELATPLVDKVLSACELVLGRQVSVSVSEVLAVLRLSFTICTLLRNCAEVQ